MNPETVGTIIGAVVATIVGVYAVFERRNTKLEPIMDKRDANIEDVKDTVATLRRKLSDLEFDVRHLDKDVKGLSKRLDRVLTLWAGYMAAKGEQLPSTLMEIEEDGIDEQRD